MSKPNHKFFVAKRSWSLIKDELLQCYLLPYFQKLICTRYPITYVDCFAGAGRFDDGNDGSPLIALKSIKKSLEQTRISNPDIQSYFIEVNHFDQLNESLRGYQRVNVVKGKFEDRIGQILKVNVGRNLFLYIDPYGIKELDFDFLSSLGKGHFNTVEILLNFNLVGFLRVAFAALKVEFRNTAELQSLEEYDSSLPKSLVSLTETANRVAGGDYWKKIVEDYREGSLDFYGAEERFIAEYCEKLREHYRYVLNMPIRVKSEHSPKYRMIHVTNHVDGVILMADNMLRREKKMREIQQGGQLRLFEDEPNVDLEKILLGYFPQFRSFEHLNPILAEFFCTYGVTDVKPLLKKFENKGQILVERNPQVTEKGNKTIFWTEKGRQTVRLKWNA